MGQPFLRNTGLKRSDVEGCLVGMDALNGTIQNDHGADSELVKVVLAHIYKDKVRSAYNRADHIGRRRPIMAWWNEHSHEAATGNLSVSVSAIKKQDMKVVSIR